MSTTTNFNKNDYRRLEIPHNKTGEVGVFYVKYDGTSTVRAARRTASGRFMRAYELTINQCGIGGSRLPNDRIGFTSHCGDKHRLMDIQVAVAVHSAWNNDGVYVTTEHDGLTIDHIDRDHYNHSYWNLRRVTNAENNQNRRDSE